MKKNNTRKDDYEAAPHEASQERSNERSDGGAMSPSMRQLILSFLESDPDADFHRDAFTRGAVQPAGFRS
jgi:hypothetical protein